MNYVKQLSIALLVLGAVSAVSASDAPVLPAAGKGAGKGDAPERTYVQKAKDWVKGRTNTQLAIAGGVTVAAAVAAYNFSEAFKNSVDNTVVSAQDFANDVKECKNNAHVKAGVAALAVAGVIGAGYYKREAIKAWWQS